jgi:hypothetical protein
MNATGNIRSAWDEVTPNCLNKVWKKLWPKVRRNAEKYEEGTVIYSIVELAKEAGLEGVNKDDVEEWLQSHGKF